MHVDLVQELPIPYYSTSMWVKNLAHWVVVVIFQFCYSIPDSLNTETNTSLQIYKIPFILVNLFKLLKISKLNGNPYIFKHYVIKEKLVKYSLQTLLHVHVTHILIN